MHSRCQRKHHSDRQCNIAYLEGLTHIQACTAEQHYTEWGQSWAPHTSALNILYGLARHLAQQLKSFICNVPLPHHSSFRCKRSNNFLNKRQKKNIYKIPIQLIINGLSKAPLCIWTTVGPVGKGHTAINHLKNKTEKKCFRNYQYYIFTEYTWNKFPLRVEKAFGSFLLFLFYFIYLKSNFLSISSLKWWLGH